MLHIHREPGGLPIIRDKTKMGLCSINRNRYILVLAIVSSSWLFAILYFKPSTKVSILQVDASFVSKAADNIDINAALRNQHQDNSSDANSSTGNDAITAISDAIFRSGSDSQRSDENPTTSGVYSSARATSVAPTQRHCVKKTNVSFLKVHKAGSTTLMNIFLRFAIQNNLNIVLPRKSSGFGFNYLGYGKTVSREKIVPLPGSEIYNILCNHVVYNKTAFRSIMPADTEYVGIVREPKSHFISASSYYGLLKNLQQYAKNTNYTSNIGILSAYLNKPSAFPLSPAYVHNRMSFDFGVPTSKFNDELFLNDYIDELKKDYSLVMIMERFQESLVMMKRTLCWRTKDILYVPLNGGGSKRATNLTETDILNLKVWNNADFKLYENFNKTFNELVAAEEEERDFNEEVKQFKVIQANVQSFCNPSNLKKNKQSNMIRFKASKWSPRFVVTHKDCLLMTESELPMMKRLITKAWDRYNAWKTMQQRQKSTTQRVPSAKRL